MRGLPIPSHAVTTGPPRKEPWQEAFALSLHDRKDTGRALPSRHLAAGVGETRGEMGSHPSEQIGLFSDKTGTVSVKPANPSPRSVPEVPRAVVVLAGTLTLCFKTKNKLDQVCPMHRYKICIFSCDRF